MSHNARSQPARPVPEKMVALASPGLARISDRHEGTPRAALFRRATVQTAGCTARARRHGEAPRFARRPPPQAATWRARCGGWLGFARHVPKTPRWPTVVANPRHLRNRITKRTRSPSDRGRYIRRSINAPMPNRATWGMRAVASSAAAPISDRHESAPRCAGSARPRGLSGFCGTRAATWVRSSLSPAVCLRWPP